MSISFHNESNDQNNGVSREKDIKVTPSMNLLLFLFFIQS